MKVDPLDALLSDARRAYRATAPAPVAPATAKPQAPAPAEQGEDVAQKLDGLFYDAGRSRWWIPSRERAGWVSVDLAAVRRELKARNVTGRASGEGNSPADAALHWLQTHRHVDFAGGLAGHKTGLLDAFGQRVLVTSEPALIEPSEGKHPTIDGLASGLLGPDQLPFFIGWLSCAVQSLRASRYVPGQAIALAGDRGCGKSLLLDAVIRPLLGGRVTSPLQAWSGETPFNADLAGCELLAIDDEAARPSATARRELAAQIKTNLFAASVRLHPKGGQPFTARPFWRVVFCVNREPEHLAVLPALDDSLADKFCLFACGRARLPFWPSSPAERERLANLIAAELPAYVSTLLRHEVPADLRDTRCGILAYQNPGLLSALACIGDEGELIRLLDIAMGDRLPTAAPLSARDVQDALESNNDTRAASSRLLRYSNSCGLLLGRLAAAGHRVHAAGIVRGIRHYHITADSPEGGGEGGIF